MCTAEDVRRTIREEVPPIVKEEMLQFLPKAIGIALRETEKHLFPSKTTTDELERHDTRIKKLEDMANTFIETIRENSEAIQKNKDSIIENRELFEKIDNFFNQLQVSEKAQETVFGWVKKIGVVCASFSAVGMFLVGIFWVFHTLYG